MVLLAYTFMGQVSDLCLSFSQIRCYLVIYLHGTSSLELVEEQKKGIQRFQDYFLELRMNMMWSISLPMFKMFSRGRGDLTTPLQMKVGLSRIRLSSQSLICRKLVAWLITLQALGC